ncbi:hypothetical protein GALMADRAFT_226979 [Galerina marginata CBS 339.88]|uniref:YCII-related domain-containing protein n=1 Tax=Galerina marginata (strain CBS 339.88) TaxID=685588 RepID=A0A067SZ11_GALM3|nr:hypothetical protein GALMADRAFT_226979 [Galerina marginata CBS 339.88]
MSDPSPTPTFLVYAPYYTDADILSRRNAARPHHLEHIEGLVKSGIIRVGGILMEPEPAPGNAPNPVGSSMIVQMGSASEVREMLKVDPYYVSNVWDKEKLVVLGFFAATPLP